MHLLSTVWHLSDFLIFPDWGVASLQREQTNPRRGHTGACVFFSSIAANNGGGGGGQWAYLSTKPKRLDKTSILQKSTTVTYIITVNVEILAQYIFSPLSHEIEWKVRKNYL